MKKHPIPVVIKRYVRTNPPNIAFLIDGQMRSLKLGKFFRSQGIKTFFYFPPLVFLYSFPWWHLKAIKKSFHRVFCPFEPNHRTYLHHGIPSTLVGHPFMLKKVHPINPSRLKAAKQKIPIPAHHQIIGLFPGSRQHEIQNLLPLFLEGVRYCQKRNPSLSFIIALSHPSYAAFVQACLRRYKVWLPYMVQAADDVLQRSHFAWIASGTMTIQATFHALPHAICLSSQPHHEAIGFLLAPFLSHRHG